MTRSELDWKSFGTGYNDMKLLDMHYTSSSANKTFIVRTFE